jgi:ABC-type multidrug transport system fused ATPase/permease subunit
MVNEWTQFSTDDAADDQQMDGNGDVLSIYSFTGFDKNDAFGIVFLYILGFAALTYYALLPPANKLEKLEPGSMTASAVKSMFEKKKVVPRAQSSISVWGDNGAQNLLRETLLSDTHEPDEDDVIKPQVQFTVDFYRVSSGMIDKADGCNVVFKNVNYIVTDKLDSAKKTQLLDNVSGQVKPGEMCALMGASKFLDYFECSQLIIARFRWCGKINSA